MNQEVKLRLVTPLWMVSGRSRWVPHRSWRCILVVLGWSGEVFGGAQHTTFLDLIELEAGLDMLASCLRSYLTDR